MCRNQPTAHGVCLLRKSRSCSSAVPARSPQKGTFSARQKRVGSRTVISNGGVLILIHAKARAGAAGSAAVVVRSNRLGKNLVVVTGRFDPLRSQGAKVQRLLWASTSTKNPEYPDTMYVDELIGPDTVNTMPPDTIDAFRDHGKVENTLEKRLEDSEDVMRRITDLGINLMEVTELLQEKGVAAFAVSYNQLLSAILAKMTDAASEQS